MHRFLLLFFVIGVVELPVQSTRAETNWTELATNMIWCYQEKGHKRAPYFEKWGFSVKSEDGKSWVPGVPIPNVSRSREEYVRDIQVAAVRGDFHAAEEIYRMCQRGRDGLKYATGATWKQWESAVQHAAACYDPQQPTNSPRVRSHGQVFNSPHGPITCVH